MKRLRSGRREVALFELCAGEGPTLLLLHELGGGARDWRELAAHWPGRALALDLAGHGDSSWCRGGSYSPELLAADADAALAELGEACVAGAGVGAYAALLLAGARPARVPAALLLPGRGLDGAGPAPNYTRPLDEVYTNVERLLADAAAPAGRGFDPMLRTCETDVRPPEYARDFAEAARRLLLAEDGTPRPPWWQEVRKVPSAEAVSPEPRSALGRLHACSSRSPAA